MEEERSVKPFLPDDDAAVQKFTRLMMLSRSFALPRFAKLVAESLSGMGSEAKIVVLAAEVQHVRAEMAMLRPAPREPLLCE